MHFAYLTIYFVFMALNHPFFFSATFKAHVIKYWHTSLFRLYIIKVGADRIELSRWGFTVPASSSRYSQFGSLGKGNRSRLKPYSGETGNRTLDAFTRSRFQIGVLVHAGLSPNAPFHLAGFAISGLTHATGLTTLIAENRRVELLPN